MRRAGLQGPAAALLLAVVLAGCGTAPPAAPGAPPPQEETGEAVAPAVLAFERRRREEALAQMRQGAYADAAVNWELLMLLRPASTDYANRLIETRNRIDGLVADRLPKAAQAMKRGDWEGATQQYLAIVALEPGQQQAAEALRAIERERVKRNNLGKLSRITLTRRAVADGLATPPAPAAAPPVRVDPAAPRDRNDLEHASLLADQGEYDEAIRLLESRVAADRRDARSRDLLAEIYCRQGDTLAARDRAAAVAAYQRCLRWRPGHPVATARLRELQAVQAAAPDTSSAK